MKKLVRKFLPEKMQSALRKVYYRFPGLRKLYYLPADLVDLFKRQGQLRPPRSKIFIGDGHFEEIGREFLGYFVELGQLKPDHKVLEVGSGIGRMAIPLTGYLSKEGQYRGLDIVADGIKWCSKKITPRFPNFQFQLADIYNNLYHPRGKHKAEAYTFPYPDGYFDFIFLTSVFTHMLPAELENYLTQIARVLKPGGCCLITYFLLDDHATAYVESGESKFSREHKGCRVIDKDLPEAAIAFEEPYIRDLYKKNMLEIKEPIQYGAWSKRKHFLSSQDIILATRL